MSTSPLILCQSQITFITTYQNILDASVKLNSCHLSILLLSFLYVYRGAISSTYQIYAIPSLVTDPTSLPRPSWILPIYSPHLHASIFLDISFSSHLIIFVSSTFNCACLVLSLFSTRTLLLYFCTLHSAWRWVTTIWQQQIFNEEPLDARYWAQFHRMWTIFSSCVL